MRNLLAMGALLVASFGCGSSSSKSDASVDAPSAIDATAAIDASDQEFCQTLCDCAFTYCAIDQSMCMSECALMPPSVRVCRLTHCGYAQTNPTFHCPHVRGDPAGPGTPLACIWPEGADAGVTDAMATDAGPPDAAP